LSKVTVVDYGLGNLKSVSQALKALGAEPQVTSDPDIVALAERVILPGVGAFRVAMEALISQGLSDAVLATAKKGTPILGICLGMQLLFDSSNEFGYTDGLGLIPGKVSPIVSSSERSPAVRSTHIGWRTLDMTQSGSSIRDFAGLRPDTSYYFVHSYGASPLRESDLYASVLYGGQNVCAVAGNENVQGVQFHPEKSAKAGLRVLESFLAG